MGTFRSDNCSSNFSSRRYFFFCSSYDDAYIYIYIKYRSAKTILSSYSCCLLPVNYSIKAPPFLFPFITIIAYDLAHSVTQVKLLSALKMNAYYEYYIFVYYCNITKSLIFFFFSVTGRRKKNKGYGQMLLYFLGASKMTMLYVIMNAVAAIAGKALIVAKVALAIATAIALRKILGWFFFSFF